MVIDARENLRTAYAESRRLDFGTAINVATASLLGATSKLGKAQRPATPAPSDKAKAVAAKEQPASSALQGKNLGKHLEYSEKYGKKNIRVLENGRLRYYGDVTPANSPGTMTGRRYVHEFDTTTGRSRGWIETIDNNGRVRQVRPQLDSNQKTHYMFDQGGDYLGKW